MPHTSGDPSLLPALADLTTDKALRYLEFDGDPIPRNSSHGRALCRTINRGISHLVLRNAMKQLRSARRSRRREAVLDIYERGYDHDVRDLFEIYQPGQRQKYYRLNNERLIRTDTRNFLRFVMRRHADMVGALAPASVCEVGSGSGDKLIFLANRFPNIEFSGYELTHSGTQMARQLQAIDLPATPYGKFLGLTPEGMESIGRIRFDVGNAFELPCADDSFDLVYTSSALEQMHDGYPQALSEIHRISRRYVAFFEPFADFNDAFGRAYLWSVNYFRLAIGELPRYGFKPLAVWRSYPVKPTFAFGMVIAEVQR